MITSSTRYICQLILLTTSILANDAIGASTIGPLRWAQHVVSDDFDIAYGVASSAAGTVAITGRTNGQLTAASNNDPPDAFVAAFDSSGVSSWIDQFDRPGHTDEGSDLVFDAGGFLYVTGALGATPEVDSFLRKYDRDGNQIWSKTLDVRSSTVASAIELDSFGRLLISGSTNSSLGRSAAFVSAIDRDGTPLWTRTYETGAGDSAMSIASDESGNIYLAGNTDGALWGQQHGGGDGFVLKLDSNGDQLWARQFGSPGFDYAFDVDVDASGNLYVGGTTAAGLASPSLGSWDGYILKYDSDGGLDWARQLGTAQSDWFEGLAVSNTGMIFTAGYTTGSLFSQNAGQEDVLIAGFDEDGNLVKQLQFGTVGRDTPRGITTSADGKFMYIAGNTTSELFGQNSERGSHAFVIAFGIPEPDGAFVSLTGAACVIYSRINRSSSRRLRRPQG